MNRQIKFRAWDGKEMHTSFLVARPQFADALSIMTDEKFALAQYEKQEWKVMQLTGLKDKNGKEIFEGDLVKWTNNFGIVFLPYVIKYEDGAFHLFNADKSNFKFGYLENNAYGKEIEIIGNIYQNPELITVCGEEKK